jgi:hypothetical protein
MEAIIATSDNSSCQKGGKLAKDRFVENMSMKIYTNIQFYAIFI